MAVKTDEIWSADELVKHPVKTLATGGHAWDANKGYTIGTLVTYNDQFFISNTINSGNVPVAGTNSINWKFVDVDLSSKVNRIGSDAITGNFSVGAYLNVNNNVDVGGNVIATKDVIARKNLNVTETSTLTGNVNMGAYLNVNSNTDIGGSLNVNGDSTHNKYFNVGSFDGVAADKMRSYFRGDTWNLFAVNGSLKLVVDGDVVTTEEDKNLSSGGQGYIKYKTGLQICWGWGQANSWTYFARAFASTPIVIVSEHDGAGSDTIDTYKTDNRVSTTRFVPVVVDDDSGQCKYLAIGTGA